ncbi:hypothetical protein FACS189413_03930 [Bacteroidia bacterium]|nr:hypothetical protein FACS189413_03930 [Bacteroidia bacterium]
MSKSIKKSNNNHKFNKGKWLKNYIPEFTEVSIKEFKLFKIKPQIALITANDVEMNTVLKEMDDISTTHAKYKISHKTQTYYIAKFGNFPTIMVRLGSMGTTDPSSATLTVQELIELWKVPVVIAVGIAMGMKDDTQTFGDVLISKTISNYNVTKKTITQEIDRSVKPNASQTLYDRFVNCINWKFVDANGRLCTKHMGLIITGGSLVNDPNFTNELKTKYPDAIGNEMEASGIWAAAEKNKKDWIIVKGICDFGKDKTDDYHELAAASAVSLCKKVLSNQNALNGIVKTKNTMDIKMARINSLKLYYYRRNGRNLTTLELSKSSKIQEERIKYLESFKHDELPFNKSSFPECSMKEIRTLERILCYGRKILTVENTPSDFMGYLISFYYKNKLDKKEGFKDFKAIVFDFDGTLTINQTKERSTWQKIWVKLGYTINDCNELHLRFSNKEISHKEWCNITCDKFKNREMTKNVLKEIASEMILIKGCIPTLKKLKNEGIYLYVTSGSIKDVIDEVIGIENISIFEEIKSNRMEFCKKNGKLDKIIGTEFDFEGKAKFIEKIARELNINPYEILFIGNSNNDELAYTSGAITLCVNPHNTSSFENKKWNNTIYDLQNLDEILKYINLDK